MREHERHHRSRVNLNALNLSLADKLLSLRLLVAIGHGASLMALAGHVPEALGPLQTLFSVTSDLVQNSAELTVCTGLKFLNIVARRKRKSKKPTAAVEKLGYLISTLSTERMINIRLSSVVWVCNSDRT